MRLTQLIKSLDSYQIYSKLKDFDVKGISCDSKKILEDFIFVAIKGTNVDGHEFIEEALRHGARAVIVESPAFNSQPSEKVSFVKVKDTRKALARLATEFYDNPSKRIKVVGITGTNGKTTVSYLIEAILKEKDLNPAVLGTINYHFKDKIFPSKNTTPPPIELQFMLKDMVKEGIDYAILEVSSHALSQDRTEGIDFQSAIFTNLTQDHLDYHNTIESYFQAKAKLFKNLSSRAFTVTNNDDVYGRRIKELIQNKDIITYGIKNYSDVMAKDIKLDILHTGFLLKTTKLKLNFKTRLLGYHNVYNVLAAVSWAQKEGFDLSVIKSAIDKFHFVPGRLQQIDCKKNFKIFIDYAHTEDALKNVIKTLRQISKGRIIVVFGCGGERDKTKRPKMGYVVSELADYAIITNDNPRSEDPLSIVEDIKRGIRKNNYSVILDRREAIRKALSLAKTDDIVIVAGKGHETYQILKDRIIQFDDKEVVKECLKLMNY